MRVEYHISFENILDGMQVLRNTIGGGDDMDKSKLEKLEEQKNHNKFNSVTRKTTPENQNQTHNARKEGIQPINQKR